jgi:Flp pilus assembly protein TadD
MRLSNLRNFTFALVAAATAACGHDPQPEVVKKLTEKNVPPAAAATASASAPATPPIPAPPPPAGAKPEPVKEAPATVQVATAPPDEDKAVKPVPPASFAESMKLGKKLDREGKIDEAIRAFDVASMLAPKNPLPEIEIARLFIAKNDMRAARAHADLAVDRAPGSSAAWNLKGRIALADKDTDGAIDAFNRATQANPDNDYAWNNLGLVYSEVGRWNEAIVALEKATQAQRPEAYMFNNLGVAYEHENRLVEARSAYRQAAERGSEPARKNLAKLDDRKSAMDKTEPPVE